MKRSSPLKFLIVVILICSWFIPVFATSAKAAPSSPSGFANGFNEQFTNSASNWYIAQGTWSYGSGKIHGNGLDNDYSEVYFNRANYKNFDYQVKMKRIGCASCANYIYFRSTSTTSVVFRYTNSGYFRVDSYDGSYGTWQDWKASSAIIKGGYNVLRVVAINNSYKFYINNKLVSQGTGPGTYNQSGSVGLGLYSDIGAGNYLDVDYAVLTKK